MVGPLQQHLTEGKAYGKAEGETGRRKEGDRQEIPAGAKLCGNQGTDGPGAGKGNPFHEPGGAEGEKPGQTAGGAEPLRPEQAGFFGADASHAQELYQARAERGIPAEVRTPQSSREAREQYQWNKRQREALEQYQSYFEKYGQKPTEEQVQNNPVLSDIGQLWKANTTQAQATQKALEEIENTRIPGQAGRKLWMAAQNANTIAPLEQARARELPQLSQEDQAFVDNARKRLEELYPQRDALEARATRKAWRRSID